MRSRIIITGLVQGVGFRPFIFRMAQKHNLAGWVKNATDGVHVEVEGAPESIGDFMEAVRLEKPARAEIQSLVMESVPCTGDDRFFIRESDAPTSEVPLISPDIATCPECLGN